MIAKETAQRIVHDIGAAIYYATALLDSAETGLHFSALSNLEQMFFETVARHALEDAGACLPAPDLTPGPSFVVDIQPGHVITGGHFVTGLRPTHDKVVGFIVPRSES